MSDDSKLINFVERRKQSIEEKRRNYERVLFHDFVGCDSVIDDQGTAYPVELVDISQTGCMFQVPLNKNNQKQFKKEHEVSLRIYFTEKSYVPVVMTIRHCREWSDGYGNHYMRYGGEFDQSLPSFKAIQAFVDFIYQFAEYSVVDKNEKKVYFL